MAHCADTDSNPFPATSLPGSGLLRSQAEYSARANSDPCVQSRHMTLTTTAQPGLRLEHISPRECTLQQDRCQLCKSDQLVVMDAEVAAAMDSDQCGSLRLDGSDRLGGGQKRYGSDHLGCDCRRRQRYARIKICNQLGLGDWLVTIKSDVMRSTDLRRNQRWRWASRSSK